MKKRVLASAMAVMMAASAMNVSVLAEDWNPGEGGYEGEYWTDYETKTFSQDIKVSGRIIVDPNPRVAMAARIEWGEMKFNYEVFGEGVWNPIEHGYDPGENGNFSWDEASFVDDNNKITVLNDSNCNMNVDISAKLEDGMDQNLKYGFFQSNEKAVNWIRDNQNNIESTWELPSGAEESIECVLTTLADIDKGFEKSDYEASSLDCYFALGGIIFDVPEEDEVTVGSIEITMSAEDDRGAM